MIQIKNPCDANWQEMIHVDSGKYCGACEKVVIDFSKMNDAEIKNYFTEYATQKTCGRFLDSQLERPLVILSVTRFNKFLNLLNHIPASRAILLFLTSTSIWISSCVKNNNDITTGESIDTTESCNPQSMGAVLEQDDDSVLIKREPNMIKMGEIAPKGTTKVLPPDFFMDDVSVESIDEPDTVTVTIPAIANDSIVTIHMSYGAVVMTDTISQKIRRRKK